MEDWPENVDGRFDAGWMHSSLEVDFPGGARLRLIGRHLPLVPPAWLALNGSLDPGNGAGLVRLNGRLDFAGDLYLDASARQWTLERPPGFEVAEFSLNYASSPAGTRLDFTGSHLRLGREPVLEFDSAMLAGRWKPGQENHGTLAMELEARRPGFPASRMTSTLHNLDPDSLIELVAAYRRLDTAAPGGIDERLTRLAIGGAWQSLALAGLDIELEELVLDGAARFHGRWRNLATGSRPAIDGRGDAETLINWLADIYRLAGFSRTQAEEAARAALMAASDAGWLAIDPETLEFRFVLD